MIVGFKQYPSTKDSGVEWLGDVPTHWDVRRLRTVASIFNGATPSTERKEYWDGEILWVTPDDLGTLKDRRITDSARKITAAGHVSCGTSLAPKNSIVISTRAPIGHLGILSSEGCTNQGCRLLVPNSSIYADYLYQVLLSARAELHSLGQGTTFAELSRTKLGSFRVLVPPLAEQSSIAQFLDHITNRIDRCIHANEKLIELLLEYEQVLIQDAVTGQINVRTGKTIPGLRVLRRRMARLCTGALDRRAGEAQLHNPTRKNAPISTSKLAGCASAIFKGKERPVVRSRYERC